MVQAGRLRTPRGNVLEGVTRQTVLELAAELGVPAELADLRPEALRGADEAFRSSATGGIMPVTRVDGQPLGDGTPGPLTRQLRARYWDKRAAGWRGTRVRDLAGERRD